MKYIYTQLIVIRNLMSASIAVGVKVGINCCIFSSSCILHERMVLDGTKCKNLKF